MLVGFAVLSAHQSGSISLRPFGNRTGRKHVSGGRCHGGPPRLTGKARQTGVTALAAMISLGMFPDLPNLRSTLCRNSGGTLLGAGCRRPEPISSQKRCISNSGRSFNGPAWLRWNNNNPLKQRGSLSSWFDPEMVWVPPYSGVYYLDL